jgi:hypothetical protein
MGLLRGFETCLLIYVMLHCGTLVLDWLDRRF